MIKLIYLLTALLLIPVLHATDITFDQFIEAKKQNNQNIMDKYYDSLAQQPLTQNAICGYSKSIAENLKILLKELGERSLLTQEFDANMRAFNKKTTEDAINNIKNLPDIIYSDFITKTNPELSASFHEVVIGAEIANLYKALKNAQKLTSIHLKTIADTIMLPLNIAIICKKIELTNSPALRDLCKKDINSFDLFKFLKTFQKILCDPSIKILYFPNITDITKKLTNNNIQQKLAQLTIQLMGLRSKL